MATSIPPVTAEAGLAALGPEAVALRAALERRFLAWADDYSAEQAIYPALIPVADLDRLDFFRNFPHLATLASGLAAEVEEHYSTSDGTEAVPPEHLQPARYALPSAACFNVYLHLRGRSLEAPLYVTTAANCFRREDHYDGLRRLLGFHMREIVCVAEREVVLDYLAHFKTRVTDFFAELELPIEIVPSSDPFYDSGGARALMAQLFPVKQEMVYDGTLAIGSINFHRNFFGERCDIRTADGEHAFSGCVAFGLERWITVLTTHFQEDPVAACDRLARVG